MASLNAVISFLSLVGSVGEVHRIRLRRNPLISTGTRKALLSQGEFASGVQNIIFASSGGSRKTVIPIMDFQNNAYYGDLKLGTPQQTFRVIFDTGSADMWVPNIAMTDKEDKKGKHLYNSSCSSTYRTRGQRFTVKYGSGPVQGFLSQDTLTLGSFKLEKFTFAEVDDVTGLRPTYAGSPFDGICGLGFSALSLNAKVTNLMEALVDSKQLDRPVFAFLLKDGSDGTLVLGGSDFVPAFHINLARDEIWAVEMRSMLANGKRVSSASFAMVDSGTSWIAGPDAEVAALARSLAAQKRLENGISLVPCGKLRSIVFTFDLAGYRFGIPGTDVGQKTEDPNTCAFLFQNTSSHTTWILGDVFLRRYRVEFDWGSKRLGFSCNFHDVHCPRPGQWWLLVGWVPSMAALLLVGSLAIWCGLRKRRRSLSHGREISEISLQVIAGCTEMRNQSLAEENVVKRPETPGG